jgi:hypothetical protein
MRVDLGCGPICREGFIGVDARQLSGVTYVVDFETLYPGGDSRLPFADDSVNEVFSSHCWEHVKNLHGLLHETARICHVGASMELRVPHWLSAMAICHGHIQVIPPEQVEHWCSSAVAYWWKGSLKRFRHLSTEQVPGSGFVEASRLFHWLSAEQVMRYIPGTAHEVVYRFEIIENES